MPAAVKRTKAWKEKLPPGKSYAIDDALKLVKEFATAKFNESVDVSVNLGVDATKSDQQVRGSTVMPHGTGKTVRVAVFTQGKNAEAAKAAGADIVGFEDLADQILGPRGLMPNPKVGTVTPNVAEAVKNAKSGQVRYRTDKAGIVHAQIGRASFEPAALKENLLALVADLQKIKPATSKGIYLKKLTVSSTMGPGVAVDQSSLGLEFKGRGRIGPVEGCAKRMTRWRAARGREAERTHRRRPQASLGLLKLPAQMVGPESGISW
jgi:large subunit ribosomal protein L1